VEVPGCELITIHDVTRRLSPVNGAVTSLATVSVRRVRTHVCMAASVCPSVLLLSLLSLWSLSVAFLTELEILMVTVRNVTFSTVKPGTHYPCSSSMFTVNVF